ncbi:hypothetical protein ACWIG4_27300 [Streptomyces sp. NPDC002248]
MRIVAALFASGALLSAAGAGTALAGPPPNPNPPAVDVTAGPAGPDAATCTFYASTPNHSGSSMTGTGGISACAGTVATCASEVDIEFYNNFSSRWMTAGTSTRQTKCAPPLRSTTARTTCTNHPGDPNVAWRTTTVGSMVDQEGQVGTKTAYSNVLYVPCA